MKAKGFHKLNTEQQQNQHRDRPLNSYKTSMTEIIKLKGFVMEEMCNIDINDSQICHQQMIQGNTIRSSHWRVVPQKITLLMS